MTILILDDKNNRWLTNNQIDERNVQINWAQTPMNTILTTIRYGNECDVKHSMYTVYFNTNNISQKSTPCSDRPSEVTTTVTHVYMF